MEKYDFSGWATRNDLLSKGGKTRMKHNVFDNERKTKQVAFWLILPRRILSKWQRPVRLLSDCT